jgi:hypothetical protein
MRDLRNYLERLQKSLVRRGYEVPEIEDYSEDGLFRFAKMLEEVYNFTEFDDFFGRMQKRFYEDFVRERVAHEKPINTLEENLSDDSVEDNNEGTEIDWSSTEDISEGIEVEDYSESSEIDWDNVEEEYSSESIEVEEIDWDSVEGSSEGELIEEDNSSESFEYDWDNVEDETEGEYVEEEYDWDNVEDETEGESIEEELENESYEENQEGTYFENNIESKKDDVFSIDKSLLDEIKVQKEEKIISETIKKNNQTIDKLGSLFGSGKKKRRKGK